MPKASSPKSCSRSSTVEEGAEAILNLAVSDELSGSGFRRKPRVQDADLPLPFFITTDIRRVASPRNASLTSRQAVSTNVCRYKKRQGQISVLHPRLPPESGPTQLI